ncbi:hypothetical protein J3A64_002709 [Pseudarthrobacter sp. PvP004]|uniref:DUF3237 family protein n=1 Tax=Pseudarthrobacter sp. PvP004 TaxID=2817850 RepID=UPI0027DBDDCA|nr:DUF3237 family protein [Pseudarthrobacter sp. PvP004]MBP2267245.1 hypothetical protein [Pseudarthrobacter sp. PvP004]
MTAFPESPALTFLATLSVDVGSPVDVGPTPEGHRRIIPIVGGTVAGPGLNGRVLPAGADYQILRSAELTELDARYAVELDDGSVVYVHNLALRFGAAEDIARINRAPSAGLGGNRRLHCRLTEQAGRGDEFPPGFPATYSVIRLNPG